MSTTHDPINFLWFIPTSGDGAYLGSNELNRAPEFGYLTQIAQAADRLGYSGVLLPTGRTPARNPVTAAALATKTEKLQFLVAIRPRHRVAGLLCGAPGDGARPDFERPAAAQRRRRRQPGRACRRRHQFCRMTSATRRPRVPHHVRGTAGG
jgi:hypothetical protein